MSHTNISLRHWIAVVALAAWLPQVANFFPGPTTWPADQIRQDFRQGAELAKRYPDIETLQANRKAFEALAEDPQPLIRELWIGWVEHVGLVLLGITAGLMASRAVRRWRWAIVITALAYFWFYSWPLSLTPMWQHASSIEQLFRAITLFAKLPAFAFYNFVAPLLLLTTIVLAAIEVRRSRTQVATSNPTVEGDARKSGARPSL